MQKDVPYKWYYNKNVIIYTDKNNNLIIIYTDINNNLIIIYTDINNNLISLTYIGDPGFALGCKKSKYFKDWRIS